MAKKEEGHGKKQANLHDSFFKSIFKDPSYVRDLLRVILPARVLPHVRLEDIIVSDKELITNDGRQLRTDLLISLPLRDKPNSIEIVLSLMFEHKSYQDPHTLIQMMEYYIELLREQLRQLGIRKKIKQRHIIVPVLLLCCKDKDYEPPSSYLQWLFRDEEIPEAVKELSAWLPNMFINVVNLRKLLSPKLWTISNSLGIVVYGMDRRWQANDDTVAYILEKARLLERDKAHGLLSSLRDYYDRADNSVRADDFGRVERERWPEASKEERFMSEIYFGFERAEREGIEKGIKQGIEQGRSEGIEQGRSEGIEQGRSEGIEQGIEQSRRAAVLRMLSRGIADDDIKDVLQLNAKQLAKIKRQLKN